MFHAQKPPKSRSGPGKAKISHSRPSRANSAQSATFTFPGSQSRSQEFTALVMAVRSSNSLKAVLGVLDLTMERLGELLGQTPQLRKTHPAGVSKPYVSMLCSGHREVSPRMLKAIEIVIGQQLAEVAGEPIGMHITRNSPWHFRVAKTCERHGPYEIDGRRQHCPECAAR